MSKGIFISLEGIDGSGKTTAIEHMKEMFDLSGFKVHTTREPGGTRLATEIRKLLLEKREDEVMQPLTEVLLFSAARCQHLETVIKPKVKEGMVVISDRYVDSMIAYQGAARGANNAVHEINDLVLDGDGWPDYTFYFRVDLDQAEQRSKARGDENHFDAETKAFKQRLIDQYEKLVELHPHRFIVINANQPISSVILNLKQHINRITVAHLSSRENDWS